MTALAPEQTLHETMGRLEAALLAPVVSGELQNWIRTVEQAAATFGLDWTRYLHSVLHVQYAEISRNDPELLSCVEQMVRADQDLLENYVRFHEDLHDMALRAAQVKKHEAKLEEQRQRIEEAGISLIVKIKKQEAAAATWLAEALYRDRGVAD
jgi:hypothetical protein